MAENSHEKMLAALGVTQAEQVAALFAQLLSQATTELQSANSAELFEKFRVQWLGRKAGVLTQVTDNWLKPATPDLKRAVGQEVNKFKAQLEALMEARKSAIESGAEEAASAKDRVDLSLPGVVRPVGSRHLIRQVLQEIEDIFVSIGFSVVEGPEIETPYYNFEALNIPEFHPVRDDMDTFYVEAQDGFGVKTAPGSLLLRTHTSPVQVRGLEKLGPPLKMIAPGRVFRNEEVDPSHEHTFYQLEGMMVDHEVSVAHLIYFMKTLLSAIFHREVTVRLRPGFFPFVEPGFELDIQCLICGGSGCAVCKQSGWVELLPCGLVHPAVLRAGGADPEEWGGFAFGLGLTRLAMMRYGIDDIRLFTSGDLRFLRQF